MLTLSRDWKGGDDGKAISAHKRRTEHVRLEKATLKLQFAAFRGTQKRADITALVTPHFLEKCTLGVY